MHPPFCNAPTVGVARKFERAAPRRFLVFIRAGAAPLRQPHWLIHAPDRRYDLMANFFAPPAPDCWLMAAADCVTYGGLSKFHAAKLLLEPELMRQYAGVLLLDDDIELQFDPGAFGDFVLDNGLDLAQPALTADSAASWRVTLRHPSCAWRETNFIEVMAPFFTQGLLSAAIEEFDKSISTWGLDVRWGVRFAERRLAVIDLYTMTHRKQVDQFDGPFYRYLHSIGISPHQELLRTFHELGID
jgi:hypothetical protein